MKEHKLFGAEKIGAVELLNRMVMAPMTRCRAIGNIPNDLMLNYYEQRSTAGLIITEGTAPSPNGLGYARIPGIYTRQQLTAWKKITSAVHGNGSRIFLQLMHTGRISHPLNMAERSQILAPSAIKAAGQMWTDAKGLQDYIVPKQMTQEDITLTIAEYAAAAKNGLDAGFDGIELHGANGYLLEEFLSPISNQRIDGYGYPAGMVDRFCSVRF